MPRLTLLRADKQGIFALLTTASVSSLASKFATGNVPELNESRAMQPVRTEELLVRLNQAANNEFSLEELVPLVERAHSSAQKSWERFIHEQTENVEMPIETRETIAVALESYLDCLLEIREAANKGQQGPLASLAREAEMRVKTIRKAQDSHRQTLASGPTLFPYLNRLLLQYNAVRHGKDAQRLLVLLKDSPSFIQWIRTEVKSRSVDHIDMQLVFQLRQFLEALHNSVLKNEALPDIEDDLGDLASQIAGSLARPRVESKELGPTTIPSVNQVLEALSTWTGNSEEFEFILSLMGQCRNSLRTVTPVSSPPFVVESLNRLLACLDTLEQCLMEQIGFDQLVQSASKVEIAAKSLAEAVDNFEMNRLRNTTPFSDTTKGLSPMFRSVLQPGYNFLDGRADVDLVLQASEHLENSAIGIQNEATRTKAGDKRLEAIQQALGFMREASGMLRELATSGNPKWIDIATGLCFQATDHLSEAGIE